MRYFGGLACYYIYNRVIMHKQKLLLVNSKFLCYLCITIDFINMQKEQEHTLAAIRECLAKNMPANGF